MRLTAKSEYGVLAVIDLACNYGQGPVSAREIGERRGIPASFLEQLFVSLRRAGIVTAVRGARGGFVLGQGPADDHRARGRRGARGAAVEQRVRLGARRRLCAKRGLCARAPVWARATAALRDVFATTTLGRAGRRIRRRSTARAGTAG